MKKIVAIGRGGVGKSSFIALLAKYLNQQGKRSILLIDADPDENLAELLGLDLERLEIKTISDLLFDLRYDKINEKIKSLNLAGKIEYLLNQHALYEGDGFDPSEVPDPTLEENLELPSGRGLMLMRTFMGRVEFNDKGNRVLMEKVKGSGAGGDDDDE